LNKKVTKDSLKKDTSTSKTGMEKGVEALKSNVQMGDKTKDVVVRPDLLAKNFKDASNFQSELNKAFPAEYETIHTLRKDLKYHHIELSNTLNDCELLA